MRHGVAELSKKYAGRRLRLEFCDGEIADVGVIEIALANKYDTSPKRWGIVYDLISSNRPHSEPKGSALWSELRSIKSFELLGE